MTSFFHQGQKGGHGMTVKQKQCLLCYLGFYGGAIDGIWGPKSAAGAKAFQRENGLAEDEDFGPESQKAVLERIARGEGDWWTEIEFFRREEFACKCGRCGGYPARMDRAVVEAAEDTRRHFGSPAIVSSGLRCAAHNARVGGVVGSRHLLGKAVDFRVEGRSASQVLDYVRRLPQIRYAYAIDSSYIHMDVV